MIKNIHIRPAKIQECTLLSTLAFRSKSYWGYSQDFMQACRSELTVTEFDITNLQKHYHVAESNGKIIGYYALKLLSKHEYELDALFVEPKYIRQGVGKKLIEHAKFLALKMGACSMIIQGDPNATKFYISAGGVQIGDRESLSIPGRFLPEFKIMLKAKKVCKE